MSRLSDPAGLRVNRRPKFVAIDSQTVRDTNISYRALGLLGYLLDQKEGWQVRSDQLSKGEGREGRGAIRTTLRELAKHGYYRLERRRLRNGKCVMGTAISEYPIEQWKEDHKIFYSPSDPSVPVVEQEDGTFLVEYPDGTFGSDGFEPDPLDDEEPPSDSEAEGGEGSAAAEELPAAPQKPPARPARTRRNSAQKTADDAQKAAEKQRKDEEKAALATAADAVAKWWWEDAEKHFGPYVGKTNGYVAMRAMVKRALEKGYTQRQCADALRHARQWLPSAQQWQNALGVASQHIQPKQPSGRVTYSDSATWGSTPTEHDGALHTEAGDDPDEATFGVVRRTQGE